MQAALFFFDMPGGGNDSFVLVEGSILDGQGDAREILVDDTTGTDGHVSDFAIARSAPGETDGNARCLEGRHRVEAIEFVESRKNGLPDGIPGDVVAHSPAVEHDEYYGSIGHFCFSFRDFHLQWYHGLSFDKRGSSPYTEHASNSCVDSNRTLAESGAFWKKIWEWNGLSTIKRQHFFSDLILFLSIVHTRRYPYDTELPVSYGAFVCLK
mgnify:CR=1 FL=1